MLDKLLHLLHGLPPDLVVAVISSVPVVELRGGVPAGVFLLHLPLWRVYVVAVTANILCVTPILLGFEWVTGHLQDKPLVGPILRWALEHAEKKKAFVDRYGMWALTLWFAMPVPGFGAWSGVLVGPLAGLSFWRCLAALAIGTATAGAIVSGLVAGGVLVMK